jgi:RNA polymerase sigma factor (sigma-70 family)
MASHSPHPAATARCPFPTENSSDRRFLEDLARRYYTPLLSFFRKRCNAGSDVQDLVQQVFLRLSQATDLGQLRNPEGYIFQTAANILTDYRRRQAVRVHHADESGHLRAGEDTDFSIDRVLIGRETFVQFVQALRHLPERTRDIVVQRCFEGLKHAEIARLQGISVRAVEKHMVKALAALEFRSRGWRQGVR